MFDKKKEDDFIRIVEKEYNPHKDKIIVIVKNEHNGDSAPAETCKSLVEALNDFNVAVSPDVIKEIIILKDTEE
jgi:hypothetical protein